jgi:hypothetical protein
MSDNLWLQNLKVGDKVIISGHSAFGGDVIGKVSRLTKTQVLVTLGKNPCEYKYKIEDGRSIGTGTWETKWIYEATPEKVDAIVLRNKRYRIKYYVKEIVDWDAVPANVIDQLYVLLDPFIKEGKI